MLQDYWRTQSDRIDVSGIDANSKVAGDQAFAFIATKNFSGLAGQLQYREGNDLWRHQR